MTLLRSIVSFLLYLTGRAAYAFVDRIGSEEGRPIRDALAAAGYSVYQWSMELSSAVDVDCVLWEKCAPAAELDA